MAKKKKAVKHVEVEKAIKLPHCQGKKCPRFSMFRESCQESSCFFLSEEEKQNMIENLAKTLIKITED